MSLRVTTAPNPATLVSLDDAKAHLRVETSDDDDLITGCILAASRRVERETQRRYLPQTLVWTRQEWANPMILPIAPGDTCDQISVTGIEYADLNGVMQTLDPSQYWAKPHGDTLKIVPQWFVIWPWLGDAPERLRITIEITTDSAPSDVAVHACKLLVSHYYQNREAVVGVENRDSSGPLPYGVQDLLFAEQWSA